MKTLLYTFLFLAAALTAAADKPENIYFIKGDRVVSKQKLAEVDYATFTLPEGISDTPLWLSLDNVGKNTVTYTVNTQDPMTAYAHNILSWYDVNYNAMDINGESFDALDDENKLYILKYTLSYNAYVGAGTHSYTQKDYGEDGSGFDYNRFNVAPSTDYFLCAWEIDPATYEPMEYFTFQEFTTLPAGQSSASFSVTFSDFNDEGAAFNFTGSDDIVYVQTAWGQKKTIDAYIMIYGMDFLMGTFGQRFTLEFLQGTGADYPGIPNATWPIWENGTYTLICRAYDSNGDMKQVTVDVDYAGIEVVGPTINILDKSKGDGAVMVNFEISPSNVTEAYVRMLDENTVDGRLNMGYELYEIAMGGDAEDITNAINATGEYTFRASGLDTTWRTILIYAKDKDGGRTTQRINFNVLEGSTWSIPQPVHAPGMHKAAPKRITSKRNPTIVR